MVGVGGLCVWEWCGVGVCGGHMWLSVGVCMTGSVGVWGCTACLWMSGLLGGLVEADLEGFENCEPPFFGWEWIGVCVVG